LYAGYTNQHEAGTWSLEASVSGSIHQGRIITSWATVGRLLA